MMKLQIDLLRHGESELSHTLRGSLDDALTPLGWQQMQRSIDQSGDPHWDMIFSSPLQRCRLFAEQLAHQQQIPLKLDPNLQEMHFGDWEGQSIAMLYQQFPELLADFWQQPMQTTLPNAESMQQFQQRVSRALNNIQQQMQMQQQRRALLVTHGGVIKLLKCIALTQPLNDLLKMTAELGQLNAFFWDTEQQRLVLGE
jgi:alpha-ribazole phosphatase